MSLYIVNVILLSLTVYNDTYNRSVRWTCTSSQEQLHTANLPVPACKSYMRSCKCQASGRPAFMVDKASSTPLHSPPVKGRPPNMNTIGLPRCRVSSNTSSAAVPLQHNMVTLNVLRRLTHFGCMQQYAAWKGMSSMIPANFLQYIGQPDSIQASYCPIMQCLWFADVACAQAASTTALVWQ